MFNKWFADLFYECNLTKNPKGKYLKEQSLTVSLFVAKTQSSAESSNKRKLQK